MPPKKSSAEAELKIRVPKDLFERINNHRYDGRMDSRKEAVIDLLERGLDSIRERNESLTKSQE